MRTKYCFFTLIILILASFQVIADEGVSDASVESAENWLNLLDSEQYSKSWDKGSFTLKLTVSKPHWKALMQAVREPLGTVESRKLIEKRPAKDPGGLPKGDYMVLFFQTTFSNKKDVHELLTLVQESDGEWRVLTYQVQ